MNTNDKNDKNTQREAENNSTEGVNKKSQEQHASFKQGGQQPGTSQGGQGGNQGQHDGKNPRHDQGDEQSEFAREDS